MTQYCDSCYRCLRFIANAFCKLEMWANAQRDGRPAEYRWRPLFNVAAVWLTPITTVECLAVTLPRRENR